jgi:SAM-dependent methyltransferase
LWNEFYPVLNVLRKTDLKPSSQVLDIACGPGWISHFIGKMGHRVLGVDISEEMLSIARERIEAEPFPPFPLKKLSVDFCVHDIEESPIATTEVFDLILLDSALHHFFNPIQALRNISTHLAPDGLVAIIEGLREFDGPPSPTELVIMEKYKTLERPYSRNQMQQILNFSGFNAILFYDAVNGLVESGKNILNQLPLVQSKGINYVIAAKDFHSLKRIAPELATSEKSIEWIGFHEEEKDQTQRVFRWSLAESHMQTLGLEELDIEIESIYPHYLKQNQMIEIHCNGAVVAQIKLTPKNSKERITLKNLKHQSKLDFFSDACIYPFIHKIGEDKRQLAFMLRIS